MSTHPDEPNNQNELGINAPLGATHQNAREPWPVWAEGALAAMRVVPSVSRSAKAAGVDRRTLQRLIGRDPSFAEAFEDARQEALDTLEEIIVLRARQGQPVKKTVTTTAKDGTKTTVETEEHHISDNLSMFFLKRWRPEYRDSVKVEQSGPGGGPIRIETERKMDEAADRLDAEIVRLADARAARTAAGGGG